MGEFGDFLPNDGDITPTTVVDWRTTLYERVSSNTVTNYLTILHAFFESAVRLGIIESNPVLKEEIPAEKQREYDLLNSHEINQLLTADAPTHLAGKMACRNRAIMVLFLQTGMRNSELRSLRLCDLNFDSCTITIKHGKGNKRRTVPFPVGARELVKIYLESGIRPLTVAQNDYLFGADADEHGHSTNGKIWKPFTSQGLCRLIRSYTKNGCSHSVKTHTLRHAAASLWDDQNVAMRDIQNNLGHSSIMTTEHVYVTILNNKKSALKVNDALANYIGER